MTMRNMGTIIFSTYACHLRFTYSHDTNSSCAPLYCVTSHSNDGRSHSAFT